MTLWEQILWGTGVLSVCSALHLGLILISLPGLARMIKAHHQHFRHHRAAVLVGSGFLVILLGHTLQIWVWAAAYLWVGALGELEPALYFALSNYTTLGYGDLLLGAEMRLFAAFASVNGMLIFGVSTAFLVSLISRVLPAKLA